MNVYNVISSHLLVHTPLRGGVTCVSLSGHLILHRFTESCNASYPCGVPPRRNSLHHKHETPTLTSQWSRRTHTSLFPSPDKLPNACSFEL
ncbi:hypothetical protein E2C01_035328 [Portunus trituberculatus]|uniref:Uncharacterized protein n=1 Tax=Portunus trituberculatus TaxID=210409 RepID=A0A5B7F868_PORTR|nr:hypothetical protein [Portunus trituberculatus]